MRSSENDQKSLEYSNCARYATDVTFQQFNQPSENMPEGRKYF